MSDLDIQIDVPDDDDLDSSVRVLSGDAIPPWLKAAAVVVLGGLAALTIGAFLLGRSRDEAAPVTTPTVAVTPLASATASPAVGNSLEAVETWESYARSGNLEGLDATFDPAGPQYAVFQAAAVSGRATDVDFSARNLTEATTDGVTTVSMDLVVSGPEGSEVYPFDLVYLEGGSRVWTVVDRRDPGTVALPPSPEVVEAARQTWAEFTDAISRGDGAAVTTVVSEDSRLLAEQVAAAAGGASLDDIDGPALINDSLFQLLTTRVRQSSAGGPGEALIALLDQDQRETLVIGELTSWTQVGPEAIVASLEVAGEPVTRVPFVATAGDWRFDLKGALEASGGQTQ